MLREKGYGVRRKARVMIDEQVVVRVGLEAAGGPFRVRTQVVSALTQATEPGRASYRLRRSQGLLIFCNSI